MNEIYKPTKIWSLITIAGLAFIALFHGVVMLIGIGQILSPDLMIDLDNDGSMSAWYLVYGLISLVQFPVFIATIIFFLIWLNRSYRNLLALRPSFLKFTSGWAVGWWFIPFANLVKPFQVVREVWWESDPVVPEDQMFLTESLHSAPTYMGLWWAFWLAANIVSNISSKLFDPDRTDNVAEMGVVMIITSSLTIVAAGLAIKVVQDITARQAGRHRSVLELEGQIASKGEYRTMNDFSADEIA